MPCLQGVAGVYFFGGLGSVPDTRVVVYIDYQNVYHGARELFRELNIGRGGRGLEIVSPQCELRGNSGVQEFQGGLG